MPATASEQYGDTKILTESSQPGVYPNLSRAEVMLSSTLLSFWPCHNRLTAVMQSHLSYRDTTPVIAAVGYNFSALCFIHALVI